MGAKLLYLEGGEWRNNGCFWAKMPRTARRVKLEENKSHTIGLSMRNSLAFAITGTQEEIAEWFMAGEGWVIVPPTDVNWWVKVAVSACLYPPRKGGANRPCTLDPVGDTCFALVKGATALIPTGAIGDFASAIADAIGIGHDVTAHPPKVRRLRQVTFWLTGGYDKDAVEPEVTKDVNGERVRGVPVSKLADGVAKGLVAVNKKLEARTR